MPSSPGVRQYFNIDEAFKTGFEITWVQEIAFGLQHQMGVAYTYAQNLVTNEPLPEIAPLDFRYTLSGTYFDSKLKPELRFRYVMEQSRVSTEFGESSTPAFTLLDFNIAYQMNEKIRLGASVDNIFNETYYEHLTRAVKGTTNPIYAMGRSFNFSLNVTF